MSDTLGIKLEHLPSLRFDDVKELLIKQYEDIPYDTKHGLPPAS